MQMGTLGMGGGEGGRGVQLCMCVRSMEMGTARLRLVANAPPKARPASDAAIRYARLAVYECIAPNTSA